MNLDIRTYLVGRNNSTVRCDIALPETETSVSRKHLELTVTADGKFYIVHVQPPNTTKMQAGDGRWLPVSQAYVDYDTPLLLGSYATTVRSLLGLLSNASPSLPGPPPAQVPQSGGQLEWDPERGTFLRR